VTVGSRNKKQKRSGAGKGIDFHTSGRPGLAVRTVKCFQCFRSSAQFWTLSFGHMCFRVARGRCYVDHRLDRLFVRFCARPWASYAEMF